MIARLANRPEGFSDGAPNRGAAVSTTAKPLVREQNSIAPNSRTASIPHVQKVIFSGKRFVRYQFGAANIAALGGTYDADQSRSRQTKGFRPPLRRFSRSVPCRPSRKPCSGGLRGGRRFAAAGNGTNNPIRCAGAGYKYGGRVFYGAQRIIKRQPQRRVGVYLPGNLCHAALCGTRPDVHGQIAFRRWRRKIQTGRERLALPT